MALLSNLLTHMIVTPILLLSSFSIGYFFKNTGVPIPGIGIVDLWGFLVKNKPQTATEIAFENFTIWTVFYTFFHYNESRYGRTLCNQKILR